MRRVAVVITARPSYSRIKTVLVALKARPDVELQIVAAASALVTRYGRIVDQIRADGFEVAAEVSSVVDGDTLADTALSTGLLLMQLAGTFDRLRPDVVVTIADRHETIATAIAASYQRIPLVHIQGGELTGSIDNLTRHAVSQLADYHLVSTEAAAARVRERRPKAEVFVTGCPSIDLAAEAVRLGPEVYQPPIVVLQHPVTGEDAAGQMRTTIDALRGLRCLYFWPGEDAGSAAMAKELRLAGIKPVRNLPPVEFLRLLLGSRCLVGNSSVGIREGSFLGLPVVNIGTRQANRERGPNVLDVAHDVEAIRTAVGVQTGRGWGNWFPSSSLYGDGKAGERIASLLAGDVKEEAA